MIIPRGVESIVRFVNNAEVENSVHLHGSPTRAPFDGWAENITNPGEYKDYYFPNFQSGRMNWYHDHAMSIVSPHLSLLVSQGVLTAADGRERIHGTGGCIHRPRPGRG